MTRVLYLFLISIAYTNGQIENKNSLTFVIDVTRSMERVRRQVEKQAIALFDAVVHSNESSIDNFVLVTFADIDVIKTSVNNVTITKNREKFKDSLALTLVTGGDCPEYSLSGIETGIENSLPGSTIYVFTDAFAKDYKIYKHVTDKAQKKEIQVIFVLTGMCNKNKYGLEGYDVYTKLASDTSGQVFNLHRDSVVEILKFVQDSVVAKRIFLAAKSFPPGIGQSLNYTSDHHTTNTTISVAGNKARINVKGPGDKEVEVKDLVHLINVKVSKVNDTTPGTYIVTVECSTDCRVVVTARSDIKFRHGFSAFLPVSMKDTTVKPSKDDKTYLTINVIGNFLPQSVMLLDVLDNITPGTVMPLKPLDLDDAQKLFVTAPFNTPLDMFRIVVTGLDLDNNATISRMSTALVEPQDPNLVTPTDRKPTAAIEGGPKITVEFDTTLQLKCTVNAFPKPNITWENHGTILESKVFSFDLPYDYVSIHKIEKVNENTTYTCKSTNTKGEDIQSIIVEAKPKKVFQVVEEPKDITVEYDKTGKIKCKINANPPANITWFKNGEKIVTKDGIQISVDGSELTIQHMRLIDEGNYACEVKNDLNKKEIPFKIKISGVDAPVINKIANILNFEEGLNVTINCRIKTGTPKPTFQWYYNDMISDKFVEIEEAINNEDLSLENIKKQDRGTYKCLARNEIGNDTMETYLIVEYAPTLNNDTKPMNAKAGDEVTLTCPADGIPKPVVKWTKDDMPLFGSKFKFTSDHKLIFHADLDERGVYKCDASNKLGSVNKTIIVEVEKSPKVLIKGSNPIDAGYDEPLNITCEVLGYPKPGIVWTNISSRTKLETNIENKGPYHFISYLVLEKVTKNATYQCKASNTHGDDDKEVTIITFRKPFFNVSKSPKDTIYNVKYDDMIQFGCKVDAYPPAEVNWYKNGKGFSKDDLSVSSGGFKLTIKQMQPIDEGKYMCIANNSDVTYKYPFEIRLTGVESPEIGVFTKTLAIPENGNTRISCRIKKGTPKPSIQWYYNDMISDLFVQIKEAKNFEDLSLEDIKRTDQGTYKCVATNIVGNDSMETNLLVEYAPTVDIDFETVTVLSGGKVKLTCLANGVPEPDVIWTKDDKPLIGSKLISSADHSLEFYAALDERGVYKCDASNKLGSVNKTIIVEVEKSPKVLIKGSNPIDAGYDEPLYITCEVLGYPKPDIVWTNISSKTKLETNIEDKGPYHFISYLVLEKVTKNATYQCKASNKHGDDDKKVTVITFRKPFFNVSESPKDTIYNVKYDDMIQFGCKVDAYPPAEVNWYKNGKGFSKDDLSVSSGGFKLTIKQMQPIDEGKYMCIANNSDVTYKYPFEIRLTGVEPPEIGVFTKTLAIPENGNTTISCRIEKGTPKPSIQWYYNDMISDLFVQIKEAKDLEDLSLEDIKRTDQGTYKCVVTNIVGNDSMETNLLVEYAPTVDNDFETVTVLSGGKVKLTCLANGVPEPDVIWTKDDKPLIGSKLISSFDHSLEFIADLETRGIYICSATNILGTAIKTVNIKVEKPPTVVIAGDSKKRVYYDGPLQLECYVEGYPAPDIKWTDTTNLLALFGSTYIVKFPYEYVNILNIHKVRKNAVYQCEAENIHGDDKKLVGVETKRKSYFKVIQPFNKIITYNTDDQLYCKADAYPPAKVTWYNGSKLLTVKDGVKVYPDGGTALQFKNIQPSQKGQYTCKASNSEKTETYIATVAISGLELPEFFKTTSEKDGSIRQIWAKNGTTVALSCKIIKGIPKPSIKWFRKHKKRFVEIIVAEDHETYIVNANKKTAGEYGCQANNTEGYASLKMDLKLETWKIKTRESKKQTIFEHKTLHLYCKCKGEPKSKIKWIFEGTIENPKHLPLSLDDVDTRDLNVKDIQYDQRGRYTCVASNSLGKRISYTYEVDVYTDVQIHNKDGCTSNCIIRAVEGDRVLKIHCNATGYPKPRFKWTLDGFGNSEDSDTITIFDVKKIDAPSSITCEARNYVNKFAIATYKVIVDEAASVLPDVISKLKFVNEHVETTISLGLGKKVDLDCRAHGNPIPKVSWSHDGRLISKMDVYRIVMKQSKVGKYKCEATNGIDTITRIYDVTLNECLLKIDPDAKKQPLILSNLAWPSYKYDDGYLYMPQNRSIILVCQKTSKLKTFDSFYVYAYCNKTTQIEIEGKAYDYSDIECTEQVKPRVKWTGKRCFGEESEIIKIYFELDSMTVDVYEVCINLLQDIPFYTKHKMSLPFADSVPKKVTWFNDRFDFNFENIYDQDGQIYAISSMMGRLWHKDDRCVFSKRQLVNSLDVFPGIPQSATFTYLNVVPHWSTCSTNNWDDVESRVRRLSKSKDDKITVWTGTAEYLQLKNSYRTSVDIYISDQSDPRIPSLPVSTYLWKVVQNPAKRASLAIIQLNIPDITVTEASDYIKCRDMCHLTKWMKGPRWRDMNRGYIFCCKLKDFESNFGYGGLKIFGHDMYDLLIK